MYNNICQSKISILNKNRIILGREEAIGLLGIIWGRERKFHVTFGKVNADLLIINNWNNIGIQDCTRLYIIDSVFFILYLELKQWASWGQSWLYMVRRQMPFPTGCPVCRAGGAAERMRPASRLILCCADKTLLHFTFWSLNCAAASLKTTDLKVGLWFLNSPVQKPPVGWHVLNWYKVACCTLCPGVTRLCLDCWDLSCPLPLESVCVPASLCPAGDIGDSALLPHVVCTLHSVSPEPWV